MLGLPWFALNQPRFSSSDAHQIQMAEIPTKALPFRDRLCPCWLCPWAQAGSVLSDFGKRTALTLPHGNSSSSWALPTSPRKAQNAASGGFCCSSSHSHLMLQAVFHQILSLHPPGSMERQPIMSNVTLTAKRSMVQLQTATCTEMLQLSRTTRQFPRWSNSSSLVFQDEVEMWEVHTLPSHSAPLSGAADRMQWVKKS